MTKTMDKDHDLVEQQEGSRQEVRSNVTAYVSWRDQRGTILDTSGFPGYMEMEFKYEFIISINTRSYISDPCGILQTNRKETEIHDDRYMNIRLMIL